MNLKNISVIPKGSTNALGISGNVSPLQINGIAFLPKILYFSMKKNSELVNLISPLGLSKRRAKALKAMSNDYITKSWKNNPSLLFGIGKYGSDAYKIFCTNDWQNVEPKDGALIKYHNWLKLNNVHLQ